MDERLSHMSGRDTPALVEWMRRQYDLSVTRMLRAISATDLVKERTAFGQRIRPAKGSVLASPVIASYDPDPDYFFHWPRDSAVVMDASRLLIERGTLTHDALRLFADFQDFSLALLDLDGGEYLRELGDFRRKVDPFYLQYVRDDDDLSKIKGERVQGEPRFNPDGTLDILKWSRPQHDGPASRALALLRLWPLVAEHAPETAASTRKLLDRDLDFVLRHWRAPSFDIWEEELGHHYYTRLMHFAALADGAQWLDTLGEPSRAEACRTAAREISKSLDDHWCSDKGYYLSRLDGATTPEKELDIATLLAVIHAGRTEGAHSILDPKVLATLARLEALFTSLYPINRGRDVDYGPAMGRYDGDRYYSGGAYYFSTLGAAEFYYRLAGALVRGATMSVTAENEPVLLDLLNKTDPESVDLCRPLEAFCATPKGRAALGEALLRRGDAFMAIVRAYTPESGDLSEQFDQATGTQTSAKNLAWSHAAFISAFASREAARLGA